MGGNESSSASDPYDGNDTDADDGIDEQTGRSSRTPTSSDCDKVATWVDGRGDWMRERPTQLQIAKGHMMTIERKVHARTGPTTDRYLQEYAEYRIQYTVMLLEMEIVKLTALAMRAACGSMRGQQRLLDRITELLYMIDVTTTQFRDDNVNLPLSGRTDTNFALAWRERGVAMMRKTIRAQGNNSGLGRIGAALTDMGPPPPSPQTPTSCAECTKLTTGLSSSWPSVFSAHVPMCVRGSLDK